jgi:probable rRNA maturation factor
VPVLISRQSVPSSPIGTRALRTRAERMLAALSLPRAELSLLLCDDPTIHTLNRTHRRRDKPTDVLAFALREGEPMPGAETLLGDVVISLDTAERQARDHHRSLWDEVTMLLAHGLLHLVGYDHRTAAEERRMNARADMLIAAAKNRAARAGERTVDKPRPTGEKSAARRPTKTRGARTRRA